MPKERRGQVICLLLGEREGQGKESRERRRRASASADRPVQCLSSDGLS